MPSDLNLWLVAGAALSAIAAVLHIAIIIKGAAWYRFFGAGEQFAQAAEQGRYWQDIVTFGIAAVFVLWSLYALAGAGLVPKLPFMSAGLVIITLIYLLRGLAVIPAFFLIKGEQRAFFIWSSVICLIYGVVHAIGLIQVWTSI